MIRPADIERRTVAACDYDLDATLASGQAFRWRHGAGGWEGVIGTAWVRLRKVPEGIEIEGLAGRVPWPEISHYLQADLNLRAVLDSFPVERQMQDAVENCRGLRLLRQNPWECLASFILSSSKQIVQIAQIIDLLCSRFGRPVPTPEGVPGWNAFPDAASLARLDERELRDCKMGFRAPYLRETAAMIEEGLVDLERLRGLTVEQARSELMQLPGVGRKVADCVLLFAYGFQRAFPVDVWIARGLQQLYFPNRRKPLAALLRFSESHFGVNAGYAQQYLFHFLRTRAQRARRYSKPDDFPGRRAQTRRDPIGSLEVLNP